MKLQVKTTVPYENPGTLDEKLLNAILTKKEVTLRVPHDVDKVVIVHEEDEDDDDE